MSNGAILLIITECDQYPVNCWIAVPFLGDSFQQFNGIANIPTFSFDPLALSYEVVAFVLKSADYSLVLWHLFLFHYNSFTIIWFTVSTCLYSVSPSHSFALYIKFLIECGHSDPHQLSNFPLNYLNILLDKIKNS